MISCSVNDPAVAVDSARCPDGLRHGCSDNVVSMASKVLLRTVKDVKANVRRVLDDELWRDATPYAVDSRDQKANGPHV